MSAYRLVIHSMLSLSSALPYVNLLNDEMEKRTGVLLLKPFNNGDFTGVMKSQNRAISVFVFNANNRSSITKVFAEVRYVHILCKYDATHMQQHVQYVHANTHKHQRGECCIILFWTLWVSDIFSALRGPEQSIKQYIVDVCCFIQSSNLLCEYEGMCASVCDREHCIWSMLFIIVYNCPTHVMFTFKVIMKLYKPIYQRETA